MAQRPEATLSHGVVRRAIDFRHCPWVRPIVADYADRFTSIGSLFAGNPADPSAWRDTITRVQAVPRHRQLVAEVVADQLARRAAPAAARENVQRLFDPTAVAVVSGQQTGAFGGPLYTVLKGVTAIQLARRIEAEHHVPVVPVFWVHGEDHDWQEIRTATTLDAEFNVADVTLPTPSGAGTHPVGDLILGPEVEQTVAALAALLPPTEFTNDVVEKLRRHYRPGATVGAAFAGWIDDLLGRHGLVVFEAGDRRVKPAVSDLFVTELGAPSRSSALAREAGRAMAALGHPPQVQPADDAVNLFYLDESGRRPIKIREGGFAIGTTVRTAKELEAEASEHPERFSPNVILRPLVQDTLFPTICYVAGPSELAYQAQLGAVYREFGVEPPLLHSRGSATILDSASARFLEKYDIPFESLQAQDESVLNHLLERQLPPVIDQLIHGTERHIREQAASLRDAVKAVDPTLTGTVDTTTDRLTDTLRHLHTKIVQASKKKDETLRRQFKRTRDLAFPAGHPQERWLNVAYFANRYGDAFVDRLIEDLPVSSSCHYLVTL
jgi:bacillithiol biosynthesis cysteine-adding enzyme BshC